MDTDCGCPEWNVCADHFALNAWRLHALSAGVVELACTTCAAAPVHVSYRPIHAG